MCCSVFMFLVLGFGGKVKILLTLVCCYLVHSGISWIDLLSVIFIIL